MKVTGAILEQEGFDKALRIEMEEVRKDLGAIDKELNKITGTSLEVIEYIYWVREKRNLELREAEQDLWQIKEDCACAIASLNISKIKEAKDPMLGVMNNRLALRMYEENVTEIKEEVDEYMKFAEEHGISISEDAIKKWKALS